MYFLFILIFFGIITISIGFYCKAENVYSSHKKWHDKELFLIKMIGFNEKYINDKSKWIQHYRRYIVLMALAMLSVLFSIFLGVSNEASVF